MSVFPKICEVFLLFKRLCFAFHDVIVKYSLFLFSSGEIFFLNFPSMSEVLTLTPLSLFWAILNLRIVVVTACICSLFARSIHCLNDAGNSCGSLCLLFLLFK